MENYMMFKSLLPYLIATGLLSATTLNASAAELVCSGTVEEISYHANDQMMIRLSSMNAFVFVCNTEITWSVAGTGYVTGPKTCAAMYSTFLAAKLSGKPINSMYFDGADVPTTCNGWGSWKNANIRHYRF
jgi:hypothetical protein